MKKQTLAEWLQESNNSDLIKAFSVKDRMTMTSETDFHNIMEILGVDKMVMDKFRNDLSEHNVVAINRKTSKMHNRLSKRI